jgi:hypothetical protein
VALLTLLLDNGNSAVAKGGVIVLVERWSFGGKFIVF